MQVTLCSTPDHKHVVVQDSTTVPIKGIICEDTLKNVSFLLQTLGHNASIGSIKREMFTKGKYVVDNIDTDKL